MPISDSDEYGNGHFGRVYEHIIKPACELAEFKPIRADDIMTTNYIALDIIKNIIECDMAICDLSSRNPNVMYELGIRQAFNLPVALIKDIRTKRVFDIQGFRDVEYDESLRIDTVEIAIQDLCETIKNTYENRQSEINSLVSLLGIEPARLTEKKKISTDTELILNSLSLIDKRLSQIENINQNISRLPSNQVATITIPENIGEPLKQSDIKSLEAGMSLFHTRHGKIEIIQIQKSGINNIITMKLENGTSRRIVISSANIAQFRRI